VALLSADGAIRTNGSSDTLATLVDAGLPASTPVLYNGDAAALEDGQLVAVATDGIRRQQDAFGGPFRRSATLSATQPFTGDRLAFDYLPDGVGALSEFRYLGVADVTASSSAADVRTVFNANPSFAPWSALDRDPDSAWRSAAWHGAVGEWIEVSFDEPIEVGPMHISFAPAAIPMPTNLAVTTDTGTVTQTVRPSASRQRVAVPPGLTSRVRLTVRAVEGGGPGTSFSIARLEIPGVTPQRTLAVPDIGTPDVIRFAASSGYRSSCLAVPGGAACDPAWARRGEEDDALDRTFTLTADRSYDVSATVRLLPGAPVERRLDSGSAVVATASSSDGPDLRLRAGAAVDGDESTAWVADPDDATPVLSLDLGGERVVRALRIVTNRRAPMARPAIVWVHAGDQDWIGHLPVDGLIRFAWPALAGSVEITIVEVERRQTISTVNRSARSVPTGISEVRLDPAPSRGDDLPTTVEFGCDAGLALDIDGTTVPLFVSAPRGDVLAGAPVRATPCTGATIPLGAGEHRVRLESTGWAQPVAVTLAHGQISAPQPASGEASVERWNATHRRVRVEASSLAVLVVHENFNDGWTAEFDGRQLDPVRVDGWQQGFVIPAGTSGVVELAYAPQRAMLAGLIVGAIGPPALLGLAIARPRRPLPPPVGERSIGTPVANGIIVVISALLTGVAGLIAVSAVLAIAVPLLGRATRTVAAVVGPALLIIAGSIVATAGSPTAMIAEARSPVVQMLCVGAVAAALLAALPQDAGLRGLAAARPSRGEPLPVDHQGDRREQDDRRFGSCPEPMRSVVQRHGHEHLDDRDGEPPAFTDASAR
jgi:arabinofuranan 3-O-arabinosyltransferase